MNLLFDHLVSCRWYACCSYHVTCCSCSLDDADVSLTRSNRYHQVRLYVDARHVLYERCCAYDAIWYYHSTSCLLNLLDRSDPTWLDGNARAAPCAVSERFLITRWSHNRTTQLSGNYPPIPIRLNSHENIDHNDLARSNVMVSNWWLLSSCMNQPQLRWAMRTKIWNDRKDITIREWPNRLAHTEQLMWNDSLNGIITMIEKVRQPAHWCELTRQLHTLRIQSYLSTTTFFFPTSSKRSELQTWRFEAYLTYELCSAVNVDTSNNLTSCLAIPLNKLLGYVQ